MVNSEFGGSGIGYISSVRARLTISQDAFRFTLYSTSRVVSRAPRVRRHRCLDGRPDYDAHWTTDSGNSRSFAGFGVVVPRPSEIIQPID